MDDLSQYLDLYVQTSKEYIQGLNAALLVLEKSPADKTAIEDVFRNAHSLKSQSAAMGYQTTGFLCHVVEDVFYEIKQGRMRLTPELADKLFGAFDALGQSIAQIEKDRHEADLSEVAQNIKALAGVKTEGAGKSDHSQAAPSGATSNQSTLPPPPPPTSTPQNTSPQAAAPISTISVKVAVLDEMMNLLESLLVERLGLKKVTKQLAADYPALEEYTNASEKILANLQYQLLKARAVPVSLVFDHFPRAVRDLARAENKQVELVITGSDLDLDRTIVDRLDEPLTHLVRNAVSHGIKDRGTITLSAVRQKDYAEISVSDDGQGIDWQKVAQKAGLPANADPKQLQTALFSGISTSESVTQISGRGVGLLAIKKMVDAFGGRIDVSSTPGKGTSFRIRLPLTLAIVKALLIAIGDEHFAIPTQTVERIITAPASAVKKMADQEVIALGDSDIPLLRPTIKSLAAQNDSKSAVLVVLVDAGGQQLGLVVDKVLETTDIIVKPLPDTLKGTDGFSGVTILGDGKTALIINTQELI
ncbi:MAG TPA: ATP-binding protein [Candidatus Saccharimonadales bacterium]|nr:ATP-binding protein [Candidatus Saccharimonadales bacterium]